MEAIVGFSFGSEGSKSNVALAKVVNKIRKGKITVLQKEIADCTKADMVVSKHPAGKYLDTEEVTRQAAFFLKKKNVRVVWVVAQPFLHRKKCTMLLRKQGFVVKTVPGRIPFDPNSKQWWTRSRFSFLVYAISQKTYGRRGH